MKKYLFITLLLSGIVNAQEIEITSTAGGGTVTTSSDGGISISSSAGGGTVTTSD